MEMDENGGNMDMHKTGRCCGCCCDYRRGVWILDVVIWVLTLIGLIYSIAIEEHMIPVAGGMNSNKANDQDAQTMQAFLDAIGDSSMMKFSIASNILDVCVFLPMAIYGAFKFRWYLLIPECIWRTIALFIGLIMNTRFCREWDATEEGSKATFDCETKPFMKIIDFIILGFVLYPHVVFIRQCRNGLMSPETYETKEKSCCCC